MVDKEEFDQHADTYNAGLSPYVKITGESIEFFAQSRIKWVAKQLKTRGDMPQKILDYGCGIGVATPFFLDEFGNDCTITGVDVSSASLDVARSKYGAGNINFVTLKDHFPSASMDLAFCNGVFHHIPLDEQDSAMRYVYDSLRPGGYFALWENNPWNPLTRYNMAHAEIDRNAIAIIPPHAKKLVVTGQFELLEMQFHFIFPNFLKFLRPLETLFAPLPIGAQYVVFCRKAAS
jgi:Methylase involved in ubiquinone/menaquinone biosynthesis